jgi:hypothetical protein
MNFPDSDIFESQSEEEVMQELWETSAIFSAAKWPDWSESITGGAISPSTELSPISIAHTCFSTPVSQFIDSYYE